MPVASPPPISEPVALAIARHVAATTDTLIHAFAITRTSLDEPRAADPERALRQLGYLVETLVGAAAGAVIGQATRAVARDIRAAGPAIAPRLHRALRALGPGSHGDSDAALTAFAPPSARRSTAQPLLDELDTRVHHRLSLASRDHHSVLIQLATGMPAEDARLASQLAALDRDPMLAQHWTEHLVLAWSCYAVAVSGVRNAAPAIPPALAATAACRTWLTWLARVRGERGERPLQVAAPSGDYIMAVG